MDRTPQHIGPLTADLAGRLELPDTEGLDAAASRTAWWLTRQLADLQWGPAYRVGLAVAQGDLSRGEILRVLRATLELRSAGKLRAPAAGYFVAACKRELQRRGISWRAA